MSAKTFLAALGKIFLWLAFLLPFMVYFVRDIALVVHVLIGGDLTGVQRGNVLAAGIAIIPILRRLT